MRAVVFDRTLQLVHDAKLRDQNPGDVVLDILRAGICETDLQLCRGYMGFRGTLGHEFVGRPRTGRLAGQRVVGEINCPCRVCEYCRQGLGNHCPSRTVVGIVAHDGAFADQLVIPEANLLPVPDSVSDSAAVMVEPVAAACRIPQQLSLQGGEQVAVLGDGRLGNLTAQVLKHHGCLVRVVGRHAVKLRLLEELGIPAISLDDLRTERTSDVVVDCTGSPTGLPLALQLVKPCGTIVLKTTVAAEQTLHMAPFVIDEIRLVGSRCGPFAEALDLITRGVVHVEPLLSASYPLDDALQAFSHAARRDTLKVILEVR